MSETPHTDADALIRQLRRGDERAMAAAYRTVFATPMGRAVLAHLAMSAGVGQSFGPLEPSMARWAQGRHDGAIEILQRAGFDAASAAAMTLTDQLEGQIHELPEDAAYEPDLDEVP